jgi:tRNA dimethylallyltransferase
MTRVLAVVGPTATGKSELAVALAERVDGEIVNADSMQLYRGMDIGTAKLPLEQRRGVPHHLLDIWPIPKSAAVAEYQQLARAAIADIHARGRLPVLVGGSGLYLRGALDRLDFPGESQTIRARRYAELAERGAPALHAELAERDPAAAAAILATNGRRIVRALEVIELTGRPFTATMPGFESVYDTVFVGLDRADLDDRVARRVDAMIEHGFLDEVRRLLAAGLRASPTAGKALGYAQLLTVLDDDGGLVGDLHVAVEATVRATRRFVRRQRSWFRRDPRITWLDAADPVLTDRAHALLPPTLGS